MFIAFVYNVMYNNIVIMKKIMIKLIRIYQVTPLHSHSKCRFIPTCSNYSIEAIEKYGFFKGICLSIKRILRCNPFGKTGYDPVPVKEEV